MLDILKEKLLAWTAENSANFHGNIQRYNPHGDKVWETTPTGYFLIGADKTEYRDYNGKRYVLEVGDHTESLQIKQSLAALAKTKNMAQIEDVTLFVTTSMYGIICTYSEHQNPISTRGIPFMNATIVKQNGGAVTLDLTKRLVKESENLIFALDELLGDTTLAKYPAQIDFSMLYLDKNNTDYSFWSGDFYFTEPRLTQLATMKLYLLNNIDAQLSFVYDTPTYVKTDLETYMNTECTIYQNL